MPFRRVLLVVLAHQTLARRVEMESGAAVSVDMDKSLQKKNPEEHTKQAIMEDCAVGSSKMGIGPISFSKGEDCNNEANWGLALSGNGIMAEGAAAGVLRALKEMGQLEGLSTISSVSGGSWFNTQFAYSKEYYEGVVGEDKPLDEFYTDYQGRAMGGMMEAMMSGSGWEGAISAMHASFDAEQKDLSATNENRKGNKNADLLICTTLVGGSLLSDNSTIAQLSSQDGTKAFYSNPAFWLIPTSGGESWNVPGVDLKSAKLSAGSLPPVAVEEVLPAPSVTKVSAMSSAANGITANPELSELFQPQDKYEETFGSGLKPSNGICTTKGETCSFPSMMAVDGCYVDNLGLALNVGYMQKKFPGKNLALVAVSSEMCERKTDPTCIQSVRGSAFRSLFSDAPYSKVGGWLPATVPGPDRTIFKESITDEEALGQQTGYGGMTFVTGTFTTVQNDHFGVAAGTKVSLIVLNVNGPLYLAPGPGEPEGAMEGLSSVAVNAYHSIKQITAAFETNGKVSSDDAFLYYQTVNSSPMKY